MRSASKENLQIRQEVLTLKCNWNSLKMHGALWVWLPTLIHTLPVSLGPSPLFFRTQENG